MKSVIAGGVAGLLFTVFILCIIESKPTEDKVYRTYYLKGVEAQQNNVPPDACPYSMGDGLGGNTLPRTYWMLGWTDSKLNKVKQ